MTIVVIDTTDGLKVVLTEIGRTVLPGKGKLFPLVRTSDIVVDGTVVPVDAAVPVPVNVSTNSNMVDDVWPSI